MKPRGIMHKTISQVLKHRESKLYKTINNDSKIIRHVRAAQVGPVLERLSQDSHSQLNAKLLYNTMCLEFLPHDLRNVTLSPFGNSARQILGIISPYAKEENSKEIINITRLLVKSNGDVAKEKKALRDVKLLLNKYGDTALNEFFNEYLKNCREVWYKMHDGHDHHASDEDIFKGSIKCINEAVNRNIALLNDIGSFPKKISNNSWFVLTSVASCLEASVTTVPLALNYHADSGLADQHKKNEPDNAAPAKESLPQQEQSQQKIPVSNTLNPEISASHSPIIINNNVSGGQGGSATIGNVTGGQGGNATIGNVSTNINPPTEINVNINIQSPTLNEGWHNDLSKEFNSYAKQLFNVYDNNFTKVIDSVTNILQIMNYQGTRSESPRSVPQTYPQNIRLPEHQANLSRDLSLYDEADVVDGSLSPGLEHNTNIEHLPAFVNHHQAILESSDMQAIADAANNSELTPFDGLINSNEDNARVAIENDTKVSADLNIDGSELEQVMSNPVPLSEKNEVDNSLSSREIIFLANPAPVLRTPTSMGTVSVHDQENRIKHSNIVPINSKKTVTVKDIINEINERNNRKSIDPKTVSLSSLSKFNSDIDLNSEPSFEKKVELFGKLVKLRQSRSNTDFQRNTTIGQQSDELLLNTVSMMDTRGKPLSKTLSGRRERSKFDERPIFTTVRTINNFNLRGGHNLKNNHGRLTSVSDHNFVKNDNDVSDEKL